MTDLQQATDGESPESRSKMSPLASLGIMSAGCTIVIATYWRMLEHGYSIGSMPNLPWYEYWVPGVVGFIIAMYGMYRVRYG